MEYHSHDVTLWFSQSQFVQIPTRHSSHFWEVPKSSRREAICVVAGWWRHEDNADIFDGASKTNISQEAVHPKFWGRKELPQWEETRACMSSYCNCVGRLWEQCESCPKNSRQKCWMLCTSSGCRRIFIESKMIHLKASDKRRLSVTYTSLAFREDPVMQFVSEREPTNEIQKELFTRALWTQNKYWDVIYLYTFWEASSRLKDKVGWNNIHSFVVFPSLFLFIIWLKPIPVFSTVLCFASFFLSPPFTKYKQNIKRSFHP